MRRDVLWHDLVVDLLLPAGEGGADKGLTPRNHTAVDLSSPEGGTVKVHNVSDLHLAAADSGSGGGGTHAVSSELLAAERKHRHAVEQELVSLRSALDGTQVALNRVQADLAANTALLQALTLELARHHRTSEGLQTVARSASAGGVAVSSGAG